MRRLVLAGFVVLAGGQLIMPDPAQADHRRHWFFGSYERYDEDAFDYRREPQIYRPRSPIIEYEDEAEWAERRRERSHPWRERRVRYDLSPRQRKKAADRAFGRQLRALAHPPLPREKPHSGFVYDEPFEDRNDLTFTDQTAALKKPQGTEQSKPARKAQRPSGNRLSCSKAKEIVAGFGFSDIRANSCDGRTYSFAARRDGNPFTISLSSSSGELTEVKRQ